MTVLRFTYRSGQRPLDGFTLKRGVGQGGFGEVYFAVSDGGKEVALKLLRGHTDSELRGITHCLNLKHHNLVHLYDLRTDERGDKWVVMEYVFGESLAQVINRHPTGLSPELIREWTAALARGVSYLHDRGVVHRDLKPANIFIEHGLLKIGDYGLSRRMSSSERGELTRGVGTPHYMAPEIKNGNYSRSIDIYACGVILFEMLTGHPPFEGETAAEVLMKHQLDTPDFSKAPAAMRPVLQKVLDKDPAKRFATVMEFAKAVELTLNAERPGTAPPGTAAGPPIAKEPIAAKAPSPETVVDEHLPLPKIARPTPRKRTEAPETVREWLTEVSGSLAAAPLIAGACTAFCALVPGPTPWSVVGLGRIFLLATLLSWALILVGRMRLRDPKNTWGRRIVQLLIGCGVGAVAFWLDGWTLPSHAATATSHDLVLASGKRLTPETLSFALRYVFYFGLATAACRWWVLSDRRRKKRVRFFPVAAVIFWSSVFVFLWPWETVPVTVERDGILAEAVNSGIAPMVIAAIVVQVASAWSGPPIPVAQPVRKRMGFAYC
jgi:hypothetical protein